MKKHIENLVKEFIEANKDYKNDINNFVNYLETQEEGASFYNRFTLGGMSTRGIIESVDYYVSIGQFKKKETARKYLSSIGQLFEFIFERTDIENTDLKNQLGAPANREESYIRRCNEYVNNCDLLAEKEKNRALNDEEARELLNICDKYIADVLENRIEENNNLMVKKMIVAMSVKLMLFTGITYRQIRVLRFSDLDFEDCSITINGYTIRLPQKYNRQIRGYRNKLSDCGFDVKFGYLFTTIEGEQWGEKTSSSGIPDFLRNHSNQSSITSVVKYGVTKLLLAGMSDNVVVKLTGVSRDILEDCVKPEEENMFCYINDKLLKNPLYSEL